MDRGRGAPVSSEPMSPEEQSASGEPADEATGTLGVLFVHGIGLQKRAETLVGWGEIVADWRRRWLNFDHTLAPEETTHVEVVETRLGLDDPGEEASCVKAGRVQAGSGKFPGERRHGGGDRIARPDQLFRGR